MPVNMLKVGVIDPSDLVAQIFQENSISDVCVTLQALIQSLSEKNVIFNIPKEYQTMDVGSPELIESWFDVMKNDSRLMEIENFNEFFGVLSAALRRLRELGVRRV